MSRPTRYALIGAGARAQMYLHAMSGVHAAHAELVAWGDVNPGRLDWNARALAAAGLREPVRLALDDLAGAIRRAGVERVIVTAPDHAHAGIVVAALEAGADVVVEKPLTIDAEGADLIADAVARTGGDVVTTFNYRYAPRNAALREVIARGEIGEVTSVHFEWLLDTSHGADYFRRWHRHKRNSGGLLVHKSSHHFDLASWWLADEPVRVFASGGLRFYGDVNGARRGAGPRPSRGTTDAAADDPFALDLREHDVLRGLYLEQEHHDGYLRDRDVFDPGIDIEDNLSLVIDFARGASMTYALNAHSPWEGYAVAVNGTKGRAELTVVERGSVTPRGAVVDPSAHGDVSAVDAVRTVGDRLVVQPHFGSARVVAIPHAEGGHGGADAALLRDVFLGPIDDDLERAASWRDGLRAVSVGIAGNASLATGMPVRTDVAGTDDIASVATRSAAAGPDARGPSAAEGRARQGSGAPGVGHPAG